MQKAECKCSLKLKVPDELKYFLELMLTMDLKVHIDAESGIVVLDGRFSIPER